MDCSLFSILDTGLGGIPLKASLPNMIFFHEINDFIDDELINEYLPNLGRRVMRVLGGLGTILLTLWITIQGYRIVTGQSRESMMALVLASSSQYQLVLVVVCLPVLSA